MSKRLTIYVEKLVVLSPMQYGSREGDSPEMALLKI